MACRVIHSWTFSSLVGAFLDLFIAYFLLCASTVAFFASKFLSVFGLCLPCPCDGLFSAPNSRNCLQRFLVDSPIKKISSVQKSVKGKFPFDSILMEDHTRCQLDVKLLEMAGGPSYSSSSEARERKMNDLVGMGSLNSTLLQKGSDDCKGKTVLNQRPRPGTLRRRRRAMADGNRILRRESSQSPYSSGRIETEIGESDQSSGPVKSGGEDGNEASVGIHLEGHQHSFKWSEMMGEIKSFETEESSGSNVVRNVQLDMGSDRSEINAIRVLEQALEEEHTARAALYQELEKERSAAATAADEAMAMILRLQKEKASSEMEARQYQRMIEEKSAYDEEEMNILKEILVRREREKHFLEKEIEAYRKMMIPGNEEHTEILTQRPHMSFDASEDPSLMLQQISEYFDKKEMVKNMNDSSDYDASNFDKHGLVLSYGEASRSSQWHETEGFVKQEKDKSLSSEDHHLHGPESIDEYKQEFQEERLPSVDEHPSEAHIQWLSGKADSSLTKSNDSQEEDSLEKTIVVDEEHRKNDNIEQCQEIAVEKAETRFPNTSSDLEMHGSNANQGGIELYNSAFEAEPSVLDVHVIDDNSEVCNLGSEGASELLITSAAESSKRFNLPPGAPGFRNVNILNDLPNTSRGGTRSGIRRSMSDMRNVLDNSQGKIFVSDMRRNSMSSVNYERLKLETEVGSLRERLKLVQEGREKLSFSVEHREREKLHLQLLEDIARQLREIRHLTGPGKGARQASLPPPSSKVHTKHL